MATGAWPTLLDVANRTDREGKIPVLAEMLSQCNDIEDDAPYVEANEATGHEFIFRNSLPPGNWRAYNRGTPYSKSTGGKARVGIGMLEAYSQVDRALAEHSGNKERFRESEDIAFLEGMSQTIAQTDFYGNSILNPAQYMGLSPFYNTVNTATAANASNVLNGLGAGNSNASLWWIGWGPETIFKLFPRGSKAGLSMEDKSDTTPGFDSFGNRFEAYTSWFRIQAGLCPKDWRYGVRLANLDVTNAGLAGANAFDLFDGMGQMLLQAPKLGKTDSGVTKSDAVEDAASGVHGVFYANRTVRHYMDRQSMRNRNVLLTINDYAGRPVDAFRGHPVKVVDQLLNTEAQVV